MFSLRYRRQTRLLYVLRQGPLLQSAGPQEWTWSPRQPHPLKVPLPWEVHGQSHHGFTHGKYRPGFFYRSIIPRKYHIKYNSGTGWLTTLPPVDPAMGKFILCILLAMHSPRLSETEPKGFVFETFCYAVGRRMRHFSKLKVNKVNICYCILQVVPFDIHFHYIDNTFICIA